MSKNTWIIQLILGSLIFALIVGLIIYGVTNRSLLDYQLNCPDSLSISQNTIPPPSVSIEFRNRGNIDSPILVIIKSQNVTIEPSNKNPYVQYQNNTITYDYTLQAGSGNTQYSNEIVYLQINNSIKSFQIYSSIKKKFNPDFSGVFSYIFGEVNGYYPIICNYNYNQTQWGSQIFNLVK